MLPFKEVQTILDTSTLARSLPSNFAVSTIVSMAFPVLS
jgi:hypothetical protein